MLNYRDINLYQVNSEEVSIKIAKRMHDERTRNGYTLEQLSEIMGCKRQTAAKWEKGWNQNEKALNRIPHIDQIMKLCDLYDCDPAYLLCFYDKRYTSFEIASGITGLTEESIIALNECQKSIQDSSLDATTTQRFLLNFINFILPRLSELASSATLYSTYASLAYEFESMRAKDDILEAYKKTNVRLEFNPSSHIPGYAIKGGDPLLFEAFIRAYNSHPDGETLVLPYFGSLFVLDEQMKKLVESSFQNDIGDIVRDFFNSFHESILQSTGEHERVNVNYKSPGLSERAKRILAEVEKELALPQSNKDGVAEEIKPSDNNPNYESF